MTSPSVFPPSRRNSIVEVSVWMNCAALATGNKANSSVEFSLRSYGYMLKLYIYSVTGIWHEYIYKYVFGVPIQGTTAEAWETTECAQFNQSLGFCIWLLERWLVGSDCGLRLAMLIKRCAMTGFSVCGCITASPVIKAVNLILTCPKLKHQHLTATAFVNSYPSQHSSIWYPHGSLRGA